VAVARNTITSHRRSLDRQRRVDATAGDIVVDAARPAARSRDRLRASVGVGVGLGVGVGVSGAGAAATNVILTRTNAHAERSQLRSAAT